MRDVDARSADRLRVLTDVMRTFAEATTDATRLLEVVARSMAEVIGDVCVVFLLAEDRARLVPASAHARDPELLRSVQELLTDTPLLVAEHPGAQRILETREPMFVPRVDLASFQSRGTNRFVTFQAEHGIRSILVLSLHVHHRPLGILVLSRFAIDSLPYDEHDRDLGQNVADHAALAIANSRLYDAERAARAAAEEAAVALRESEQQMRALLAARTAAEDARQRAEARFERLSDAGIIGILVARLDGTVLAINDYLVDTLGYARDEILSGNVDWRELTPPEWADVDARAVDQLRRTGVGPLREKEYARADGRRVPVLVGSARIEGTEEVVSFILDLTERKHTEATLERMSAERAVESQFRIFLEAAPDAIVIVDRDGQIRLVNGQTERMFGYPREELVGQSVDILVPDRFRAGHPARRRQYFEQPAPRPLSTGLVLSGRRKSGSDFPIELSLSPLQIDGERWVASSIRDITERVAADAARFRLAALVDSSADAIMAIGLDGTIESWNSGAVRLLGYAPEEIVGRPVGLLVPAELQVEERAVQARVATGEQIPPYATICLRKDGSEVHVGVTRSPVRDASGRVIALSTVARDITQEKRAERALLQAKDTAELANRELETFSYSVAHDLRAPLRAMNGFAEMLLEDYQDKVGAEGQDWLREIVVNSKKMGDLIDALLALSRLARTEPRRELVDLGLLFRNAARQATATEKRSGIDFVVEEGLKVEADRTLAQALLQNLVANAVKFTARTEAPRIELGRLELPGGERAFFVRDNGAGFDMAFASKLFVPFQRLHTVREFPGTGIGLATVHRIVVRHGGRCWGEGIVGGGATFFFTLPSPAEGRP